MSNMNARTIQQISYNYEVKLKRLQGIIDDLTNKNKELQEKIELLYLNVNINESSQKEIAKLLFVSYR